MSAVPRPMILPSRLLRTELRAILCRNHVEVPVEVHRSTAIADGAAHDARILELADGLEFDQLRRETQPFHGVAHEPSAAAEVAARRVLRVDRDELLHQRDHLVGTRREPRLHVSGAVHHLLLSDDINCGRTRDDRPTDPRLLPVLHRLTLFLSISVL